MRAKWLLAILPILLFILLLEPALAPGIQAQTQEQQSVVDVILPASELPSNAIVLERYDAIGYIHALVPTTNTKAMSLLAINESSHGTVTIKDNWELNEPKYHALLDDSVPLINADDTQSLGWNGTNVTVCILDTGIDYFHPNLPAPTLARDFTAKDWFIKTYITVTGEQFNYSLNISSAVNVTDWLQIGASWLNPANRIDIAVYYPNGTLANSSTGQTITYKNDSDFVYVCNPNHACYFNIVNVTINNTLGVYTVVWNETNVSNLTDASVLLWGGDVVRLLDNYNSIYDYLYTPMFFNESRAFANIHTQDDAGHGSHVAGIITSNKTNLEGVAPGTRFLVGKVLFSSGSGWTSEVDAGIQWCIDNNADIISMSLGAQNDTDVNCDTSTDQLVDAAAKSGILPVIAAGNSGPNNKTINSPGCARGALTIGATYKKNIGTVAWSGCTDSSTALDKLACFSSRGTTLDGRLKPEVVAPGVLINSTIITASFNTMSGTSMATPHVSGLAAVLKSLHSGWNPASIKAAIINSANQSQTSNVSDNNYGFGRIDFLAAANDTNATNNSLVENTNLTYIFNLTNKSSFASTIVWLENTTYAHSKLYLYLKAPNGTIVSSSASENDTAQKVSSTNPTDGNWSVIVSGIDTNSAEDFSIAYTSADLLSTTLTKANGLACTTASECIGGYCIHGICRSSATYCGDGHCDSGETSSNCASDCESGNNNAGGGATYETFLLSAEAGEAEDFTLNRGDRLEFDLGKETHSIRLSGFIYDEREFTISSNTTKVTLSEGETAELDLNNNGIDDFMIKLLEAIPDGARIRIGLLEETPETTPAANVTNITNVTGNKTAAAEQEAIGEKGRLDEILLIGISIVIAAVIMYLAFGTKKKKKGHKKLGRRKRIWMSEYDDD